MEEKPSIATKTPSALQVAGGLAALALLLLQALGFWGASYDDSFITYRYAQQFAESGCLCYNDGERVLGTSAPGYALLLGLATFLSGQLIGPAAFGTLASLVSIASLAVLVQRCSGAASIASSLIFLLLSLFARWNVEVYGAESFPVAALVSWSIVSLLGKGPAWLSGLLMAVALSLRFDAALALPPLLAAYYLRHRTIPVSFAASLGAPSLAFVAALQLYFGRVVPQTLESKRAEASPDFAYDVAQGSWLLLTFSQDYALIAVLLALATTGILVLARRRSSQALVFGLWLVSHEVFYRAVGVPFAPWYHVSTMLGLFYLTSVGATEVQELLGQRGSKLRTPVRVLATLIALLALARVSSQAATMWGEPPDPRYEVYRAVGEALHAEPAGTVAAIEIGVIGYFANEHRVLDLLALVSPEALEGKRSGDITKTLDEHPPDYLVEVPLFRAEYGVDQWADLALSYDLVVQYEDPSSGRGTVSLYRRRLSPSTETRE
ncbi:MAG: hypothetical protein AAGK22_14760 [Acidobacteriota bacterium]